MGRRAKRVRTHDTALARRQTMPSDFCLLGRALAAVVAFNGGAVVLTGVDPRSASSLSALTHEKAYGVSPRLLSERHGSVAAIRQRGHN